MEPSIHGVLWLDPFTLLTVFEIHRQHSMYQEFVPFYDWITSQWVIIFYLPIYLFLGCSSLVWIMLLWIFMYKYLFKYIFFNFGGICLVLELLSHVATLYLTFWEPPHCFLKCLHHFTHPSAEPEASKFFTSSPTLVTACHFIIAILVGEKRYLIVV